MTIEIVSPKYGKHLLMIDDQDYQLLAGKTLGISKRGPIFYAHAYIPGIGNKLIHSLIYGMHIDHRDGNGLNNRRDNLRNSDKSKNSMNRGKPKHNTTGFKGVYRCGVRFRVQIGVNNKAISGGKIFDTPKSAAIRYNELALLYHGEFAKLNEI